jgi:hypothetical protein
VAFVRTATVTHTFTRIDLMSLQVKRVLLRCRVDDSSARRIIAGIGKRWIAEISVYGMDRNHACIAELFIAIDWARNAFHMSAGRNTVTIDGRWRNGISIEVESALELFEELCTAERLTMLCHTRYRVGVDRIAANKILGFTAAKPVRWRGKAIGTMMSVPEVDEFTVGVRIAE